MNNPEVLLFPVEDPAFRCDSPEQYQVLMNWLFKTSLELAEDYPDNPIMVCYLPETSDAE